MKNRLQELWKDVVPDCGPCPQPDVKKVQRRVDAVLDENRRAFDLRRKLKLAALCAAALVLLTGAAAVTEMVLAPPTYNVLSVFFRGDTAPWEGLMDFQPVSVSDDNYTLTVTSTVADRSTLFYTFTMEAHSDEAWEALQKQISESFYNLLSFRSHGSLSIGGGEDDPEARIMCMEVCTERGWGSSAAVRLNLMETGKWLSFSYRPVSDLKLTIGAEGQGTGGWAWPDLAGPVTLERLTLSPLTIEAEYTTENTELFPVLWFLWEDGTVSEMESLLGGEGHGSGHGTVGEAWDYTRGYSFDSVQDLSTLEAVIFGGMAYPLDHGEPYAVDLSALPLRETEN